MLDTPLVSLLRRGNLSQAQSAAFERWIDDHLPAGVGSFRLGAVILAYAREQMRELVAQNHELAILNEKLENRISDLEANHWLRS